MIEKDVDKLKSYHVFNDMLEGVQVIDPDWRYVYVNDALVKHSKTSRENLLGKRMMDVFPGIDHTPMFNQLETCMKARVGSKLLNQFEFPDGSCGYFELIMTPVKEGVMIMSVDITEQKRLELELKELNVHLERRVKERTEELSRALESEKRLNKVTQNMAAIISHDFKTPLVAIQFNVNALMSMNSKEHASARLAICDQIKLVINSMFETVDDYLNLDKVQKGIGIAEVNKIDLNEFLDIRIGALRVLLKKEQDFRISILGEPYFYFDRNIFRSVFNNLVSNAVKYSDKDVEINIQVNAQELKLCVKDFGIGIPKEEMDQLSQKYFRASNAQGFQGSGLGLNIVRQYLDLFGGKMEIESELGKGSSFTIHLPNQVELQEG